MNSRVNKIWDGNSLDSDEEYLFLSWYKEAEELGLVRGLIHQPAYSLSDRESIELLNPTKRLPNRTKDKFLMAAHKYTADFLFEPFMTDDGKGNMVALLDILSTNKDTLFKTTKDKDGNTICVVDIKGGFSNHRSRNSSDVTFPLNKKWVYNKYKIYINKIVISSGNKGLFNFLWAPEESFTTIKGNKSKVYAGCRTKGIIKGLI